MAITTQPYWTVQQYFKEKKSPFGEKENALSSRHCADSHMLSTKFNEFRYELLPHPAYSPDLALCDYFLFQT